MRPLNGEQLKLDWDKDPAIEAMIEARVAERAEAAAFLWRLRLVAIETCTLGGLVIAAGVTLGQPATQVIRAGVLIAAACFVSGMLLIGLSGACGMVVSQVRQWRQK